MYGDARAALTSRELSLGAFLRAERLALRADLLRPWANWVTPQNAPGRRYDTYFFVALLPDGQHADGVNSESEQAHWITPERAVEDFVQGQSYLLPPTWAQLDSLASRSGAEVLALEQQITATQTRLAFSDGQMQLEFPGCDRYHEARKGRLPPDLGESARTRK
jgi:hypothetical protein